MHYCFHLFSKNLPSMDEIEKILEPYNDEKFFCDDDEKEECEFPTFTWDWFQIGGRYHGGLKLKVDMKDELYRWQFYQNEPREGRLFYSMLLRRLRENLPQWMKAEEDYFGYLGFAEGYLRVDGAKISDLMNVEDLGCFGFIDIDGKAYARESWNGEDFIKNEKFDEQYEKALKDRTDCFLTVLDIHD